MDRKTMDRFENGKAIAGRKSVDLAAIPWTPHPDFKGVFMKNSVPADWTTGRLTCHLVHIEPGYRTGRHTHPTSIELHEVIAGSGKCLTERGEIPYTPGTVVVLPDNSPHEVVAGKTGLFLFAKFIPVQPSCWPDGIAGESGHDAA